MTPPNPPRIVIEVRNGQVVGVYSDEKDMNVHVLDRDNVGHLSSALTAAIENAIQVLYKVL